MNLLQDALQIPTDQRQPSISWPKLNLEDYPENCLDSDLEFFSQIVKKEACVILDSVKHSLNKSDLEDSLSEELLPSQIDAIPQKIQRRFQLDSIKEFETSEKKEIVVLGFENNAWEIRHSGSHLNLVKQKIMKPEKENVNPRSDLNGRMNPKFCLDGGWDSDEDEEVTGNGFENGNDELELPENKSSKSDQENGSEANGSAESESQGEPSKLQVKQEVDSEPEDGAGVDPIDHVEVIEKLNFH